MRNFFRCVRSFPCHIQNNAKLTPKVNVAFQETVGFVFYESSDCDLFADDCRLTFQIIFDRAVFANASKQCVYVCGVVLNDNLRSNFSDFRKLRVLCNEVGFAVQFDQNARVAFDIARNDTFRCNTGSLLFRLSDPSFSQKVSRLGHIAVSVRQCFLTIHNACAGLFTKRHYVFCGKCHNNILLILYFLYTPPNTVAHLMSFNYSASASSAFATTSSMDSGSAATSSSATGAINASSPWFASITAFAITDAINLIARIASSLPGIT